LDGTCDDLGFDDCDRPPPPEAVFVDAAAEPGGSGSGARPLRTLLEGIDAAGPGGTVHLAAGTYGDDPGAVVLLGEIARLGGVCASQVTIRGWLIPGRERVRIHDLTIETGGPTSIVATDSSVEVERVVVFGDRGDLAASHGAIEGRAVSIEGYFHAGRGGQLHCERCISRPSAAPRSVFASEGEVTLEQVALHGLIRASEGGALTLRDALVRGGAERTLEVVGAGSVLAAERLVVADAPGIALWIDEGTASLTDATVEARAAGALVVGGRLEATRAVFTGGRGLDVSDGAMARLEDVTLRRNQAVALIATGAETRLDAVRLQTVGAEADAAPARGVQISDGAQAHIESSVHEGHAGAGVVVDGAGSALVATDLLVRAIGAGPLGDAGMGIVVGNQATADLNRTRVAGARGAGLVVQGGAHVELRQGDITGIAPLAADGTLGAGVAVQSASLDASELGISDTHAAGLAATRGATLELRGLVVNEVAPQPRDDRFGWGVLLGDEVSAKLSDVLVTGARRRGLVAFAGADLDLDRARVTGTRGEAADGVFVDAMARLEATDLVIDGHPHAGLVVSAAAATLHGGLITGNGVGLLRQLSTEVVLDGARIEGNAVADDTCEQVCAERPPASESLDLVP